MATTPTYVGLGTWQQTTGAASFPFPAGWTEGDLLLIVCESWNDDGALAVPAGWVLASQASSAIAAGQNTNTRNTIFYRFAQSGDGAAVTVADPVTTSLAVCWPIEALIQLTRLMSSMPMTQVMRKMSSCTG